MNRSDVLLHMALARAIDRRVAGLAQVQELGVSFGEAGSGGELGAMMPLLASDGSATWQQ
jgi:hypothetical protein